MENSNLPFRISFNIFASPMRNDGNQGILAVGKVPDDVQEDLRYDSVVQTSSKESVVYTICHAEEYIYYKLQNESIHYIDKPDLHGTLSIGMVIPKNAYLKDDKSPFSLLNAIYQKYLESATADVNGERQFTKQLIENREEFERIVDDYQIEWKDDVNEYVVMKGAETREICVPKDKMKEFFSDTQYPEFANCKQIVIVSEGREPFSPIPRPKRFRIRLNGKDTGDFLEFETTEYVAKYTGDIDAEYEEKRFSLKQLREAPNKTLYSDGKHTKVELDVPNSRIVCTFEPSRMWAFKHRVKCKQETPREAMDYATNNIDILLKGDIWKADQTFSPSVIMIKDGAGQLKVNTSLLSLSPKEMDDYVFKITSVTPDFSSQEIIITLGAQKKQKTVKKPVNTNSGQDKKDEATKVGSDESGNECGDSLDGEQSKKKKKKKKKQDNLIRLFIGCFICFVLGIFVGILVTRWWDNKKNNENNQGLEQEIQEQSATNEQEKAYVKLSLIKVPKNPDQANSFRSFLKNYGKESNVVKVGMYLEIINSKFEYLNNDNVANVVQWLTQYIKDSLAARTSDTIAYKACFVEGISKDTLLKACNAYKSGYCPPKHQYFTEGSFCKEVDSLIQVYSSKTPPSDTDQISGLLAELVDTVNCGSYAGYKKWLKEKPNGSKKTKKELLSNDNKYRYVNTIMEWIMNYQNQPNIDGLGKEKIQKAIQDKKKEMLFETWEEIEQFKTNKIDPIYNSSLIF